MNLATELKVSTSASKTIALELAAITQTKRLDDLKAQDVEIERQMVEAVAIAKKLIATLPPFLQMLAEKGWDYAFVVCKSECTPDERQYPDFIRTPREFDSQSLSEYKVRRYLRGTVQKVALWGLQSGFKVGLVEVYPTAVKNYLLRETPPFFIPGTLTDNGYIPHGEYLRFNW